MTREYKPFLQYKGYFIAHLSSLIHTTILSVGIETPYLDVCITEWMKCHMEFRGCPEQPEYSILTLKCFI